MYIIRWNDDRVSMTLRIDKHRTQTYIVCWKREWFFDLYPFKCGIRRMCVCVVYTIYTQMYIKKDDELLVYYIKQIAFCLLHWNLLYRIHYMNIGNNKKPIIESHFFFDLIFPRNCETFFDIKNTRINHLMYVTYIICI